MRLTYVIRHISMWFARVVYERDEWDLRLDEAARRIDVRIGMILHFTRFCIWLSRRVLWVLMYIGHAISCFMLRRWSMMPTATKPGLRGASHSAGQFPSFRLFRQRRVGYRKMEETWRSRRLPENLPRFINLSTGNVPAEARQKLDEAAAKKKTRVLTLTHATPIACARHRP